MKSLIFRIMLSFFIGFVGHDSALAAITLDQYVTQVRGANPNLQASKLRASAQRERVQPAGTWDDPFFAIGPDEVPVNGGGGMLRYQLSQNIPFPSKLGAKQQAAELRADVAQSDYETASRSITVAATQTFLRLYYNQRSRMLNAQVNSIIETTLASAKARYKTGDATHHDWLLAKTEISILEVERLRLEREAKTLQAFFNELRNKPFDAKIDLAAPNFAEISKRIERNKEKLLSEQPEIRALDQAVESLSAEERLAKLNYAPDFVLQGMWMEPRMMGDEMNPMEKQWGFMVGINVPIFFFRKQSNLVSAAQFEREAALLERRGLENRLNTELEDAFQQLKTSEDVVSLYKKSVIPSTEVAVKNARSSYATKRLAFSQLLDTIRTQRIQQLELVAAEIDVALASVRVQELLSSPPILRLAPTRPTLFGSGSMGSGMQGMSEGSSGTVQMGRGMSGPTRKATKPSGSESGGMQGMGGM